MDFEIAGLLIFTGTALPYVAEMVWQVPLLARVVAALSPERRAALPRHPRRPWLAVFGSARFFLALFRYALRHDPDDTREMRVLKRRMRLSAAREALFGLVFWTAAVVLWQKGWRPF